MGDDFRAFSCSVVLDNFHKKIEVLEALDDKILAGLGDGTLVVLQQDEKNPDGQWQVTKAYKNFGQRRILQLRVSPRLQRLPCVNRSPPAHQFLALEPRPRSP